MTMTTTSAPTARPSWREPMLWLVFGLPLASIVAGVGLVIVAVRAGGADSVTDQVQRVAQIQTTDMGPDQRAQAMNLSAIVRLQSGRIDVVPVTGNLGTGALRLTLAHPAQAAEDRQLTLVRTATGWSVDAVLDAGHDWNVQVADDVGRWRLRGRLQKNTQAVRLAPSQARD